MGEARELEDVGVAGGNVDDSSAVAADEKWNMGLDRSQPEVVDLDPMMIAIERDRPDVEKRTQHDERLLEPADPIAGTSQFDSHGVVLGLHVARAHPEDHPTAGHLVGRGNRPRQQDRMVKFVVEDERSQT
jgi:hypothetical protein